MPSPDAPPARHPDRWRALLAPGLLAALGLLQLALVFGFGLSPWKGGGFGMFATNDHGALRHVVVTDAAGSRVPVPPELHRLRGRVRELPVRAGLARLAEGVQDADPGLGPVRIEVRRLEFAPSSLMPTPHVIAFFDGAELEQGEGAEGR